MSKKAVFKGTVNGKSFDNVDAYNKAVTEAIKSGAEINASTSFSYVDKSEPIEIKDDKEESVDLLPSYDPEKMTNSCVDDCDGIKLNDLAKKLSQEFAPKIIAKLNAMKDMDDVEDYKEDVQNCLDSIQDDVESNDAVLNKLNKQINILKDAADKLDIWKSFYRGILSAVESQLDKLDKEEDQDTKGCQDKNTTTDEAQAPGFDKDSIMKLVNAIFN